MDMPRLLQGWRPFMAGIPLMGAVAAGLGLAFASAAQAAPRDYSVDAEASQLRIRVLRAGPLSVLAHDHILVAKGLNGRVSFNPDAPSASAGQLGVQVALLEVDDPKERLQEGFVAELTESNRASVRENMLAVGQLNAEAFPRITVAVDSAEGALPHLRLHARVKIRDREQTIDLPATVSVDGGTLVVSGEAELLQSAFGIQPYSTLFGAIAVQDSIRVNFRIVARAD
ncbi:MAG: YceI family protein [SAR324 cluster bacterium]